MFHKFSTKCFILIISVIASVILLFGCENVPRKNAAPESDTPPAQTDSEQIKTDTASSQPQTVPSQYGTTAVPSAIPEESVSDDQQSAEAELTAEYCFFQPGSAACSSDSNFYLLSGPDLVCVQYQSGELSEIGRVVSASDPPGIRNGVDSPIAVGITNEPNLLYVISEEHLFSDVFSPEMYRVHLKLVDISVPSVPEVISEYIQDGGYCGYAMCDDSIFLLSAEIPETEKERGLCFTLNGEDSIETYCALPADVPSGFPGYSFLAEYSVSDRSPVNLLAIQGYFPCGIISDQAVYLSGSGEQCTAAFPDGSFTGIFQFGSACLEISSLPDFQISSTYRTEYPLPDSAAICRTAEGWAIRINETPVQYGIYGEMYYSVCKTESGYFFFNDSSMILTDHDLNVIGEINFAFG